MKDSPGKEISRVPVTLRGGSTNLNYYNYTTPATIPLCPLPSLLPNAALASPFLPPSPLSMSPLYGTTVGTNSACCIILLRFSHKNLVFSTRSKLSKQGSHEMGMGVVFLYFLRTLQSTEPSSGNIDRQNISYY